MGSLSTLFGRRGPSRPERDRFLATATRLHRELQPDAEVIAALQADGCPRELALHLSLQVRERVDRELLASVPLPASSQSDVNYYFLLGITPRAATDQVHRAYRRKAKQVHPDLHAQEFVVDQWQDLMTVVADASDVLTDPRKRRAYDAFWRERSRTVALEYRKHGDNRGDYETRYLWEIAEMAELEEALSGVIDEVQGSRRLGTGEGAPGLRLRRILEEYEGRLIEVRTQMTALPTHLKTFSDRVRAEMQRKERLVRALKAVLQPGASGVSAVDPVAAAAEILQEIRRAQDAFELGVARPFI